jgi:5-enolpyruvylshikimate-3-phosphate synthase
VKNAVMFVLVAAILAGGIGNIVVRQIYGPTAQERATVVRMEAAIKAKDQAAYDRASKDNAVDIGAREFLWTILPPLAVGLVGGLLIYRRWPRAAVPA